MNPLHLVVMLNVAVALDLRSIEEDLDEYYMLRNKRLDYIQDLDEGLTETRRSMLTTPCWEVGGICIDTKLCPPSTFTASTFACQNRHLVCCFTWNKYRVRDLREFGIPNRAYPWSSAVQAFGGGGVKPKGPENVPGDEKEENMEEA